MEVRPITRLVRRLHTNVREAVGADKRRWRIEYDLCSERTPSGSEFLYIKGYERCFSGNELIEEDFGLSPVLAAEPTLAIEVYTRVCQAEEPVSAMHLLDVTQDLLLPRLRSVPAGSRRMRA